MVLLLSIYLFFSKSEIHAKSLLCDADTLIGFVCAIQGLLIIVYVAEL